MSKHRQVGAVMKTDVVTVSPGTSFKAIAVLLSSWSVSGVPVVDEDSRVVGVVSQGDLLEHEVAPGGRRLGNYRQRRKAVGATAAELMTRPAVTVEQDTDVSYAAKLLEENKIHRLPVVDGNGRLCGLVSRSDLLRVFLRTDREISAEIHDEVIEQVMCVDPATLPASVHDGVVTLRGEVERASMIPMILSFVRRVDGVVNVHNLLTARPDESTTPAVDPSDVGPYWALQPRT